MHLVLFVDTPQRAWDLQTRHYRVDPERTDIFVRAIGQDALFCSHTAHGGRAFFALGRLSGLVAPTPEFAAYRVLVSDLTYFKSPLRLPGEDGAAALFPDAGKGSVRDAAVDAVNPTEFQRLVRAAGLVPDAAVTRREIEAGLSEQRQSLYAPPFAEVISMPQQEPMVAAVERAYGQRCAVSGLYVPSRTFRDSEGVALSIREPGERPVDSVPQALFLSRTLAFLYEHGWLAVADDFSLSVRDDIVPEPLLRLLNASGYLTLPAEEADWPEREALRDHWLRFFS